MAYGVSRRTKEIGIRMALGARRVDVTLLVMRQGVVLVILGLCVGLVGSLFAARVASRFLYGVSALDIVSFLGAGVLMVATAVLATFISAWRATRLDPMAALRWQ
jgi:putative ABC transport system permease protein